MSFFVAHRGVNAGVKLRRWLVDAIFVEICSGEQSKMKKCIWKLDGIADFVVTSRMPKD